MTLHIEPELGVPIPPTKLRTPLPERAKAADATARLLASHGLDTRPNKEDEHVATRIAMAYANSPEETSKAVTDHRAAELTPASLQLVNRVLDEFGRSVASSAAQVRYLVTNKLLIETENPDPRVRLRALELLGKISDVGLFSEKSEITVTHQTSEDIRARLRQKLERMVHPTEGIEDAVILNGEPIDVDAELGLKDEAELYDDD